MRIDFVDLPSRLNGIDLSRSTAVVFDVLRATTTMITALANGATEIRAFGILDEARAAHAAFDGPKLLAGELRTVRPEGFDLGNRPPEFTRERVAGRTIFMATTNGTKAVRACASARRTFVATLANASAIARVLADVGDDVMLVGSGVDGAPGGEDLDGVATVADAITRLRTGVRLTPDLNALIASCSWLSNDFDRVARLRASPGGENIIKVGLDEDIAFAAQLDRFDLVAEVAHGAEYARIAPSPSYSGARAG
jgi:2-phosphosulfolactate phosphatase